MTFKIRVIGLEMEEEIILEISAETALQAMSKAQTEVEKQHLNWDVLEMI